MALDLKYCFAEQCDCKEVLFNDNTGVYSATANLTGYGAPNVESSAITQATMELTPMGYESSILFTFTIASNVITAATRTDEFAVVTDVLSLLNSTVFPFLDLTFDSILMFGDTEQSVLLDGSWNMVYTVTDGTDIYSVTAFNYFIEKATQCKRDTAIGFASKTVSETNAIKIFLNYDILLNSVGLKDPTAVDSQSTAMVDLCNKCNNC